MPTRERVALEAEKKAKKLVLDNALNNIPKHLVGRIGIYSPLGEALKLGGFYAWKGTSYCEQTGEQIKYSYRKTEDCANVTRHNDRIEQIGILYREFRSVWGNRGVAKVIAFAAKNKLMIDVSQNTVSRYMKEYPNGI
jgi:hypothetical protein